MPVRTWVFALVAIIALAAMRPAAETTDAIFYRIFLSEPGGPSLVSYGAYARLHDRVVFSLPFGPESRSDERQLVSIPAANVDWPTTDDYAVATVEQAVSGGVATPRPGLQEVVTQALTVARLTPVPIERVAMLETVIGVLDRADGRLPDEWRRVTRAATERDLDLELETSSAYARLGSRAIAEATQHAAAADVRGVRAVIDALVADDLRLGRRRPNEMLATVTVLDEQLRKAQALRLAHDHRQMTVEALERYHDDVDHHLRRFDDERRRLDDIRWLAGPDPRDLPGLASRLEELAGSFEDLSAPGEITEVHALYRHAVGLAVHAARGRRRAVETGDLDQARDAGSAAAGALLLFDRATRELERALSPPDLH